MRTRLSSVRWNVVAPLGFLGLALAAVVWFTFSPDANVEPSAYLGKLGTPVRGTFVAPPPTTTPLPGTVATPRPRPTVAGDRGDTAEQRDAKRRGDLLTLLNAYQQYRDEEGEFPNTSDQIQSLCAYKDLDKGCLVRSVLGADPPGDPLGSNSENGYWYQSDGDSFRIFAVLELDIPENEVCDTDYEELAKRDNLICVDFP